MAGAGVPLFHYRQHKGGVLLICQGCCKSRVLPLEAVIRRLKQRGLGGPSTGIRAVAGFVTDPCSCGAMKWETRPYFPARSGSAA